MQLYVCQVKTGDEKKVISQICKQTGPLTTTSFHVPERELSIRRAGKFRKETSLLFPSYIFFRS
jgi:transcription antitermination factor NusG